jgi:hypothetical protein
MSERKDRLVTFRVTEEQRKAMVMSAHDFGASLTEVVLHATYERLQEGHLWRAKRAQLLLDELEPGERYDMVMGWLREHLDRGEYFQAQARAVIESAETIKAIEGMENYRAFMAETITA